MNTSTGHWAGTRPDSTGHWNITKSDSTGHWISTRPDSTGHWTSIMPDSTAQGYPQFQTPTMFLIIMTTVNVIIFLAGLVGNISVLAVLVRNRTLFESTGMFLLNLGVADLLVIMIAQPTAMMELFTQEVWYLGEFMCRAVGFLENTATNVSILTVLVISLERYIAICHPFRAASRCLKERQLLTLIALWVLAMLISTPLIFITTYKFSEFYDGRMVPVCRSTILDKEREVYIVAMIVIMYLIPAIAFAYLYSAIIRRLSADITPHGLGNDEAVFNEGNPRPAVSRARRKVVIMLIVLIVLLFICVLPFRLVSIWLIYASNKTLLGLGVLGYLSLLRCPQTLVYLHSAVNPILYNVMSRRFRLALLRLLPARPDCWTRKQSYTSRTHERKHSVVRGHNV